ncbi:MAG: (2Fe-2S)-binding protein [Deltaproteobacteria bacterium]|nr:(2Fe-2S)-binding protein [Deltaproteobacteria bacterium]
MENIDDKNQQIIENFKVICLCKSIKKGTIIKAVQSGCTTLEMVNAKLGSGSGDCQGERCQDKIREIVEKIVGK